MSNNVLHPTSRNGHLVFGIYVNFTRDVQTRHKSLQFKGYSGGFVALCNLEVSNSPGYFHFKANISQKSRGDIFSAFKVAIPNKNVEVMNKFVADCLTS